jgi:cell division protein FtsB
MESDQPASAKKRTALGYAWEGTLASFGANGWHVLVTAAAIAGLTGIISWYRKGDAAEGVAQMFTLTSALAASGLIFAALFVFHFGRGLLKVQIDQKDDQIRSLNAKLQAIEPIRQENAGLTAQVAKLTDKHPQLRLHFRDNDDGFFCQGWFFVKVMNESFPLWKERRIADDSPK